MMRESKYLLLQKNIMMKNVEHRRRIGERAFLAEESPDMVTVLKKKRL